MLVGKVSCMPKKDNDPVPHAHVGQRIGIVMMTSDNFLDFIFG